MLRVIGLALLFVIGAAAPAEANDGHAGKGTVVAAHQGAAIPGPRPSALDRATPVQLAQARTITQSPLPRTPPAGLRRESVIPTAGLAALPPERRQRGGSLSLPWVSQGKSGLRLPVTERLSFGIGYRHLEGEDLWRRYAEAGSVDYDSHDFLLRAHWRF